MGDRGERDRPHTAVGAGRAAPRTPEGQSQPVPRRRPARSPNGLAVMQAARLAARQVAELTGRVPEGVVSIEKAEPGWRVNVEVVESHRIPDSADILAVYATELDADGELVGYHRVRRYTRGRTQEERE